MKSEKSIVSSDKEVKNGSIVVQVSFDTIFNAVFYIILAGVAVALAMEGTLVEELLKAALFAEMLRRANL